MFMYCFIGLVKKENINNTLSMHIQQKYVASNGFGSFNKMLYITACIKGVCYMLSCSGLSSFRGGWGWFVEWVLGKHDVI